MFGLTFELLDPKECRAPREGWGFVVGDLMDVSSAPSSCVTSMTREADSRSICTDRHGDKWAFWKEVTLDGMSMGAINAHEHRLSPLSENVS